MANNCWNNVDISGDKTTIKQLVDIFNSYDEYEYFNDFCNAFLKKPVEETSTFDYYHYGTKWWDFHVNYEEGATDLNINGDSAWSPPLELLRELSLMYKVTISGVYDEPGMNFAGEYTIDNGKYELHNEYTSMEFEYMHDYDSFFENYVSHLVESDVLDDYKSFNEFLESYNIDFKESEIKDLKEFYYNYSNNINLTMENKEDILKELDDINNHLKNLYMEGLSKKIELIQKKLKTVWEAEKINNTTDNE